MYLRDDRESHWISFSGPGGYPILSINKAMKSPCPRRMYFLNACKCSQNANFDFMSSTSLEVVVKYALSILCSKATVFPYDNSVVNIDSLGDLQWMLLWRKKQHIPPPHN